MKYVSVFLTFSLPLRMTPIVLFSFRVAIPKTSTSYSSRQALLKITCRILLINPINLFLFPVNLAYHIHAPPSAHITLIFATDQIE